MSNFLLSNHLEEIKNHYIYCQQYLYIKHYLQTKKVKVHDEMFIAKVGTILYEMNQESMFQNVQDTHSLKYAQGDDLNHRVKYQGCYIYLQFSLRFYIHLCVCVLKCQMLYRDMLYKNNIWEAWAPYYQKEFGVTQMCWWTQMCTCCLIRKLICLHRVE